MERLDYEKILQENLSEGAFAIITKNEKEFADWIERVKYQAKRCDELFRELKNYKDLEEQGLLLKLPVSIGDTVYVLCECGMIPQQLDGTLYSSDGSPGTATGYYCPYEDDCPHYQLQSEDLFDCDKFKQKSAVFEDTVKSITLEDGTFYISTENCNVYSPLGYAVFITKAEADGELKKMEREE